MINENYDFTEVWGLESLKMAPFADFRVKTQTLICHTSKLTCYLEVLPPPRARKLSKCCSYQITVRGGVQDYLISWIYTTTQLLTLCQFFDPVSVNPSFFQERIKIDEVVKLLRLTHTSDIVLKINIFSV